MSDSGESQVNVIESPDSELEAVASEALRLALGRWKDVYPCCFSEAYPGGLDEAVDRLSG